MLERLRNDRFLFSELVKRDFKKKYKNTFLGMLWSLMSPLLSLLVMYFVFSRFFPTNMTHRVIYIFCGSLVFSFFSDSTSGGMGALLGNAGIFTKINVPKYLFLFSRNVSSIINFSLTLGLFFIFCIFDGITFTPAFFLLLYPILCMIIFNLGMGLILSALFVFFRDMQYLWSVFTQLLMYLSAIFYVPDAELERLFLINPVYVYIRYFRAIVLNGSVPSAELHLLGALYALLAFALGALVYKKFNHKFLYYV